MEKSMIFHFSLSSSNERNREVLEVLSQLRDFKPVDLDSQKEEAKLKPLGKEISSLSAKPISLLILNEKYETSPTVTDDSEPDTDRLAGVVIFTFKSDLFSSTTRLPSYDLSTKGADSQVLAGLSILLMVN